MSNFQLHSLPTPYKTDCGKKTLRFIDESYGYSTNLCAIDCISEMYYNTCKCLPSELRMFVEGMSSHSFSYGCWMNKFSLNSCGNSWYLLYEVLTLSNQHCNLNNFKIHKNFFMGKTWMTKKWQEIIFFYVFELSIFREFWKFFW